MTTGIAQRPMKLRADLSKLRECAATLRSSGMLSTAQLIENAITDIECLSEDLEMEREITREMAAELAFRKPPL